MTALFQPLTLAARSSAVISGAGTDVIKVRGVRALHGGSYSIIPDQIEAGTSIYPGFLLICLLLAVTATELTGRLFEKRESYGKCS